MITNDITLCVNKLEAGNLVGFPTETVYGLGARADLPEAVNKIFKAKSRPVDHPLIIHGSDKNRLFETAKDIPEYAHLLADKFWPGPLSLILNRDVESLLVCDEATGGQKSVALRMPENDVALELFSKCDFLVAGPSANIFKHVSPTSPEHVISEFGNELTVLNGGDSNIGVESTIVSCLYDKPKILREGSIDSKQIAKFLYIEESSLYLNHDISDIKVSGNLKTHYSPDAEVLIFKNPEEVINFLSKNDIKNAAYLGKSEIVDSRLKFIKTVNSNEEFAHELYAFFRNSEDANCEMILVIETDNEGIGAAINDRLYKAGRSWGDTYAV